MMVALVIPTIRSLTFLESWHDEFKSCHAYIIEDHTKKTIMVPQEKFCKVNHYDWTDIKRDFGKDEWIFSRQNAGIRCYGFWKAYHAGADVIITLDDDCYPVDRDFINCHVKNLSLSAPSRWTTTYQHPEFVFTRGIPYGIRGKHRVVVSHGLWTNQIDLDAKTQKKHSAVNLPSYPPMMQFIQQGVFFTMCSMNLAFHRDVTPLMYFPLMGKDPSGKLWGYDRFDDIWAGIFAKKIMDHLGLAVINGSPFVEHRKASNLEKNLEKEKKGMIVNETLWKIVDNIQLKDKSPAQCYKDLATKIKFPENSYFFFLRKAMMVWAELFI